MHVLRVCKLLHWTLSSLCVFLRVAPYCWSAVALGVSVSVQRCSVPLERSRGRWTSSWWAFSPPRSRSCGSTNIRSKSVCLRSELHQQLIQSMVYKGKPACAYVVPAQHQFGIFGDILLHQISQQGLHDVREVLQLIVECHSEKWRHVATVPLGEVLLLLQGVDKLQKTVRLR